MEQLSSETQTIVFVVAFIQVVADRNKKNLKQHGIDPSALEAVFILFCKSRNWDDPKISGARGRACYDYRQRSHREAAWPWQVAGEMLKWMADRITAWP